MAGPNASKLKSSAPGASRTRITHKTIHIQLLPGSDGSKYTVSGFVKIHIIINNDGAGDFIVPALAFFIEFNP